MLLDDLSHEVHKEEQSEYWANKLNSRTYDHPVVELFARQRLDYLGKFIDFKNINSAFDIGCGDGFSTHYLDQMIQHVEGGDVSELMLQHNPLPKEKLHLIDAEQLPFENHSYDLVYTWEVLHHLENPDKAVEEMARISKKYVVLFEPNMYHFLQFGFGLVNKYERGNLRSRKSYLERLCKRAGLDILHSSFGGRIFPNVTPFPIAQLLAKLPYATQRFTGISVVIIAEKA